MLAKQPLALSGAPGVPSSVQRLKAGAPLEFFAVHAWPPAATHARLLPDEQWRQYLLAAASTSHATSCRAAGGHSFAAVTGSGGASCVLLKVKRLPEFQKAAGQGPLLALGAVMLEMAGASQR